MKIIPIILAVALATIPGIVFAQSATQMTVLTDKQSYTTGDTISISGKISSLGASNSAVLQVYNPFNVLIQIGAINIASGGTFSTTIKAQGQSWSNDGLYQIKVLYISVPILATATANVDFKAIQVQSSPTQSPSPTTSSSQTPPAQTSTQNGTQTIIQSSNQTAVEEQIQQRIALANKLKQELNQNTTLEIPFWVKDTARKWHDGTIDNAAFSKDIQYFISSGLVKTNGQVTPTLTFEHIPSWVKQAANWWAQGLVQDYEYANSIQFLLDKNIIRP